VPIDQPDRRYILFLSSQVATFSKLAQLTTNEHARGVYLTNMLTWQGILDATVLAAMKRAGEKPAIGSCWGCRAAGRAEGYEEGLRAAGGAP
jgi:hypothetical protein